MKPPSHSQVPRSARRGALHRRARDDAGDTLLELLLALVLLGIAGLAIVVALETAIMGSAVYRKVATMDTVLKSAANEVASKIQTTATAFTCPSGFEANFKESTYKLPSHFTLKTPTVERWINSSEASTLSATCKSSDPLVVSLTVTGPRSTQSISFIVDNPTAPAVVSGTSPSKLLFVSIPQNGYPAGQQFEVAVEVANASGEPVTGDISDMSMSIASGPGSLSSTCNTPGVQAGGVYTFSACSVSKAGTYKFKVTDGTIPSATTTTITFGTLPTITVTNKTVSAGTTLKFTAKVSGSSTSTPAPTATGSVTVTWAITAPTGASVPCSSTTHAGSSDVATYTCSILGATQGLYTATATYPGDAHYEPAIGHDSSAIVGGPPQATSVTLNPITTPITYRLETVELFGGYVTGLADDGYPEGTVTVKTGSTILCTATLTGGSGDGATFTCPALSPPTKLAVSATAYPVVAHYTGGTSSNPAVKYDASTSPSQGLTVTSPVSEPTSITLVDSATSIPYAAESTEIFSATVSGVTGDGYPQGTVTIKKASTTATICTASLTASSETTHTATYKCALTASQFLPAGYTVKASYGGGTSSTLKYDYIGSTSKIPVGFTVTKVTKGTTTTLSRSTTPIPYAAETTEIFSATVSGTTGDGYPQGTVTIKKASTTATICTGSLTASSETTHTATYKCALTASQFLPAGYTVKASYDGGTSSNAGYDYTGSTSGNVSFTVSKHAETTSLTLSRSATPLTYGSETSETFTVTVTGSAGAGYPKGAVHVKSSTGATLCTSSAASTDTTSSRTATYHCHLTPGTKLSAGTYSGVKAKYTGGTSSTPDYSYNASPTSSSVSFTVSKQSETTSVTTFTRSAATVTYGSETSETFTVTVTGSAGGGYPEGAVHVKKSTGATLCTSSTVSASTTSARSATYHCHLTPATQLSVGSYTGVKAKYTGGTSSTINYSYAASATSTNTVSLTVTKASKTTTTSLTTPTAVTHGSESETFKGKVTGQSGDGYPEGTVAVETTTGVQLCSTTLGSGGSTDYVTYTCSFSNGTLGVATYDLTATYTPATTSSSTSNYAYTGSTTTSKTLTVSKQSETTSVTTFTRSAATVTYGSETSETFTVTVTGSAGGGYPEGAVHVKKSTGATLCTSSTVSASTTSARSATYHCHLTPATQLSVGSYTGVKAKYTGGTSSTINYSYAASATSTNTVSLTVTKASKTTTTSLTTPTAVTHGSESETFKGKVTGQSGDGYPEGTVAVETTTGVQLCSTTLGSGGSTDYVTYTCSFSNGTLGVATYDLTATYTPATTSSSTSNYAYTGSTTTSKTLTVSKVSKTTTTTLTTPTSVTHGSESETFKGRVTGQSGDGYPKGTVAVETTTAVQLCSTTLGSGGSNDFVTYTCSFSNGTLGVGNYELTATYTPATLSSSTSTFNTNDTYATSTSTTSDTLTVDKPSKTTTTTLTTPTSVTHGSESETFKGRVTGQSGDGYPEGTVAVKTTSGVQLCSTTLGSGGSHYYVTYTCTFSNGTLGVGTYDLTATYTPATPSSSTSTFNTNYTYTTSSSTTTEKLTVNGTIPVYVGVGSETTWTSYGAETVAYPSGLAATDLLLLLIDRSYTTAISCPSGWTTESTKATTTGANAFLEVCYTTWTSGSDVSVTVPGRRSAEQNGTTGETAEVVAFSGETTSTPFDVVAVTSVSSTGTATFTPTGLTTSHANDLAVSVVMENDDGSTIPTLTQETGTFTAKTSEGVKTSTSNALDLAYKGIASAGAVTFPTWHTGHTVASESVWIGISLAIRADPPAEHMDADSVEHVSSYRTYPWWFEDDRYRDERRNDVYRAFRRELYHERDGARRNSRGSHVR